MESRDDLAQQAEEFEALSSIYGDDLVSEGLSGDCHRYSMTIRNEAQDVELVLLLSIPFTYPSQSPPVFEISCAHMNGPAKTALSRRLQHLYTENLGQPILFLWFEAARDFIDEYFLDPGMVNNVDDAEGLDDQSQPCSTTTFMTTDNAQQAHKTSLEQSLDPSSIQSGDPLTDRKSTFQAHLAPVLTKYGVQAVLNYLQSNPKVARATHNIYAYRIYDGRICIQDCEDDGENQAGSRLLHLLEMMDARNVLIVVTRWYGGIHLGPDRFKHISNVARELLEKNGYGKQDTKKEKRK